MKPFLPLTLTLKRLGRGKEGGREWRLGGGRVNLTPTVDFPKTYLPESG